jgi:hypothetical protein
MKDGTATLVELEGTVLTTVTQGLLAELARITVTLLQLPLATMKHDHTMLMFII